MSSASHAPVLLSNSLSGTGVRVHSATSDGFLTLSLYNASPLGSGAPQPPQGAAAWVRVNIGTRTHELWLPLAVGYALTNMPIFQGEEVWMATNQVNTHAVVGVVTARPLA